MSNIWYFCSAFFVGTHIEIIITLKILLITDPLIQLDIIKVISTMLTVMKIVMWDPIKKYTTKIPYMRHIITLYMPVRLV